MSNTTATSPTNEIPLPARLDARQNAPDFTLPAVMPDGTTTDITLSDVIAGRRVILYCYPAAMTPGCTTQACDFRDNIARLGGMGYTVLGMSKDPIDKLERFRQRDQLTFPLLSDPDLRVHRLYGAYGEKKLYGRTHVGVLRSTFVIGTDGRIELARYNVRAKGHVDSLIKALGKLDDTQLYPAPLNEKR